MEIQVKKWFGEGIVDMVLWPRPGECFSGS